MKKVRGVPHEEEIEYGDICQLVITNPEAASHNPTVSRWENKLFRFTTEFDDEPTYQLIAPAFDYVSGTNISFFFNEYQEPYIKFIKVK